MDRAVIRVKGKAEPIPSGVIAKKKTIDPIPAKRTIQPLSNIPIAINPCPIDIIVTIVTIFDLNHPLIKSKYTLNGVRTA